MALEERMQRMIAEHEKMFADATHNIKEAQSWYKKDYDKKKES